MNSDQNPYSDSQPQGLPYPPFPEGCAPRRNPGGFCGPSPAGFSPPPRRSGWRLFGKVLLGIALAILALFGMGFLLLLFSLSSIVKGLPSGSDGKNMPVEKVLAGSSLSPKKIVVLPIEGAITENEFGFIRNSIQTAYEDPRLSGLVLRVNSPGGTISGSDYYYKLLTDLKNERKVPVYVSMGSVAASGGYYVSMAGQKIFAERSTITGSIGVIAMLMDASSLCEKIGVRSNYIVSGKNKGMGDITRPMTDEERAIWQNMIDESYEQFLSVIKEGRPAFAPAKAGDDEPDSAEESADDPDTRLRALADGRVYSAAKAKELGLIDEIGFLQDAVEAMIRDELKVSEDDVEVVRYRKEEGLLSILENETEGKSAAGRAGALLETLAAPNLYYILPGTLPVF
ncbi:MAG: signal peptide peptidase SppA [Thermoguttaceae bacterium]|nr:signal peptide peptidase SppA [Thermoguttaceae bacterium]